ncbi:hypothetical protein ACFP3U_25900 [Kitasatospora misakiensis]|uniref:Uncharacterized protein n=1 Tax=Kitasatospora misakiensis TaxID=67330 RepID=A0ABW0X758_9ACTN
MTSTGLAALASHPLRTDLPGVANFVFLFVLCVGSVLLATAIGKRAGR